MSAEELESVVSGLPPAELARFSQWFEELIADQWEGQIEQDVLAGRLDASINLKSGMGTVSKGSVGQKDLPSLLGSSARCSAMTRFDKTCFFLNPKGS